jgi:hypothetical protein
VTAALHPYGFEMEQGVEIEIEAETIRDAMAQAERETGRVVVRGRCLDDYDETTGRADLRLAAMFAEIRATSR